jgi:hypothetical protein
MVGVRGGREAGARARGGGRRANGWCAQEGGVVVLSPAARLAQPRISHTRRRITHLATVCGGRGGQAGFGRGRHRGAKGRGVESELSAGPPRRSLLGLGGGKTRAQRGAHSRPSTPRRLPILPPSHLVPQRYNVVMAHGRQGAGLPEGGLADGLGEVGRGGGVSERDPARVQESARRGPNGRRATRCTARPAPSTAPASPTPICQASRAGIEAE